MLVNANAERVRQRFSSARQLYKRCLGLLFYQDYPGLRLILLKELAFCYLLEGKFECSLFVESKLSVLMSSGRSRQLDSSPLSSPPFAQPDDLMQCDARLAVIHILVGRLKEGLDYLERVLCCLRSRFEGQPERLVPCMILTASVMHLCDRFVEAEALFREVLQCGASSSGAGANGEAVIRQVLRGLGIALCSQGREREGQLYCNDACLHREYMSQDQSIANELSNFVHSYCNRDEFDFVKPVCRQAHRLSLIMETSDLPGELAAFARLIKIIVPEFRKDEIDLRIERLYMAA